VGNAGVAALRGAVARPPSDAEVDDADDDSDDGESFGNEIEGVDKVEEAKKATHDCSIRDFLIFAAKNIAKHRWGRA
jgi:hypothetical protein